MIIGLTGLANSGKTTVADHLVEKYGFIKVNFKDCLVDEMKKNLFETIYAIAMNNTSPVFSPLGDKEYMVNQMFRLKPPIMRALMQNYGTEVRRGDDPDYWVKKWQDKISFLLERGQNIVTDDVRFLNEADKIKLHGGKIIRVERDDLIEPMSHRSELEQKDIDEDTIISVAKGEHDKLFNMVDKSLELYAETE